MSYNEQIFEKAKKEISRRRHTAETQAKQRRDELITACPEIEEIEQEIARAGLEAIRAISMRGLMQRVYWKTCKEKSETTTAERVYL